MSAIVLQVLGVAAIAVGAGLIFIPAGLIVAGLACVAFGVSLERD